MSEAKSKSLFSALTSETFSAGLVASIFGCVATSLIIVNSGTQAGMTGQEIASWLFACWFFGGTLGVIIAYKTRQPIAGAWSIPAAVMLGGTLQHFSMSQAVGAYFLAGVIVLALGLTGTITRIIKYIPVPIIMAMIAGALLRFATGVVTSVNAMPLVCGGTVLIYFISLALTKKVSPIIPALIGGVILSFMTGSVSTETLNNSYVAPTLFMPEFDFGAFMAISIPVALLVIGAENAQATGVLMSEGYKPPVRTMTIFSGIGGMIACFFGGHNANIAGPMTAICSSSAAGEDKEKRFMSAIVCGVICLVFGALSSYAINFIKVIPLALIGTVAGLAMINVILQALQMAFITNARFQIGAFVAFVVAISNISLFKITAPFWALVAGVVVTLITERQSFKQAILAEA